LEELKNWKDKIPTSDQKIGEYTFIDGMRDYIQGSLEKIETEKQSKHFEPSSSIAFHPLSRFELNLLKKNQMSALPLFFTYKFEFNQNLKLFPFSTQNLDPLFLDLKFFNFVLDLKNEKSISLKVKRGNIPFDIEYEFFEKKLKGEEKFLSKL
jgi:hypothetical protein